MNELKSYRPGGFVTSPGACPAPAPCSPPAEPSLRKLGGHLESILSRLNGLTSRVSDQTDYLFGSVPATAGNPTGPVPYNGIVHQLLDQAEAIQNQISSLDATIDRFGRL